MVERSELFGRIWDDWWDQNIRFGIMDQLSLPVLLDDHGCGPMPFTSHCGAMTTSPRRRTSETCDLVPRLASDPFRYPWSPAPDRCARGQVKSNNGGMITTTAAAQRAKIGR